MKIARQATTKGTKRGKEAIHRQTAFFVGRQSEPWYYLSRVGSKRKSAATAVAQMVEKKKGWSCLGCVGLVGLLGCGGIISLIVLGAITGPQGGGTPRETQPAEKTISYEVLRKEKRRGDGKLFLEVLVSGAASKQDVLKLAESLRREHDRKFAAISIYDSREASQRRQDESYPEKELSRHWLVVIDEFGQEIRWVAEGRGH